jgi:Tubulin-tyrosine ligase family
MLKRLFTNTIFPFWFFHLPILPYFLFLSLKRGSFAFFTNTNPNIYTGGFVNSSKIDAFKGIDSKWLPKQAYFTTKNIDVVQKELSKQRIYYPMILKPNKGERGFGVVKINNKTELIRTLDKTSSDFIVQEYIDYPLEFGVLYYRNPKTDNPDISSICFKEMPFVIGNGKDELQMLIWKKYNSMEFENLNNQNRNRTIDKEESFSLEYIAHRSRKCLFKNFNHIYSKELIETFRLITCNMENFHFGRFDIKVNKVDDLISGNGLKILEVNGVNSQPIHIFDPHYSFYKCYRDLHAHWYMIYQISKKNSSLGFKPMKTKDLIKELINKNYVKST